MQQNYNSEVSSPRWQFAWILRKRNNIYEEVKNRFLEGIRPFDFGAVITNIHRVMRPRNDTDTRFEDFRKQVEICKNKGNVSLCYGWYGTTEKGVQNVLSVGFSEPTKVEGIIESYGVGVYLSVMKPANLWSTMFSEVDGNGEKHVILCTVLLGNSEKIEKGSQQMYPSSDKFDTGIDDLLNPKWFVVWCDKMNTHILPEYVVSYRPSTGLSGQLRGTLDLGAILSSSLLSEKLFTKLGTMLPASKIESFQNLCYEYKDGKVSENNIVSKLRSVAGDGMIESAIFTLCGLILDLEHSVV